MAASCGSGNLAVSRCSRCDRPRCYRHMTHTYGATLGRNLCCECAAEVDRENTRERRRIDVSLLQQDRYRAEAVQDAVCRLVEAGAPGAIPHVHVVARRLLPPRRVPQAVAGFPLGLIRYRYPDPEADGVSVTDEAEALVLTDGRIVLVGGGEVTDVDQGVVLDRIRAHACRCGVDLEL